MVVAILLEGVLFIALVAVVVALVAYGVNLTPVGRWARQRGNRLRLERRAALTCPIHGLHAERDMVRLPGGSVTCPECYAEAFRE